MLEEQVLQASRDTSYRAVKESLAKNFRKHWQLYLIAVLPVAYIVVFHYVPMCGVLIAFEDFSPSKGIFRSDWVGLKYFRMFFTTTSGPRLVWNTLSLSLYNLVVGFFVPVILALMLNEVARSSLKKGIQMITYAPHFISTVVIVGILFQIMDLRTGILNRFINLFGARSLDFMGHPEMFRSIYVWSGIWQNSGWGTIIYLAALSSVSVELYDAAKVDGTSIFQKILHIDLPSIAPTMVVLLILSAGQIMNVGFEKVYLMQRPINLSISEILSTFVYKVGLNNMDYSFSTAINLFNSIVNMILLAVVNMASRRLSETSLW